MIDFIKKLEERIASEQEKMVGKAILYAENSEAFNRNGYMTHKYARNVLREVVAEYKESLSKLLESQEARKKEAEEQQKLAEFKEVVDKKTASLKEKGASLASNVNKSSSKEEAKTADTPKMTSTSEGSISPIEGKPAPKKVPAKRGRPKKKK